MQEKNQRASQATAKHQAPFWSLSNSVRVYAKLAFLTGSRGISNWIAHKHRVFLVVRCDVLCLKQL